MPANLMKCRSILVLIVVTLAVVAVYAEPEEYARPKIITLRSAKGGFEVKVPKTWKLSEEVGEHSYDAILANGVGTPARAAARFFIRLRRDRDYRALFDIDPKNLDDSSFKYVADFAFSLTPHNAPMVYERNRRIVDLRSKRYFIDAGLGTSDCVRAYVEIGIGDSGGLLVTGRMPCSNPEKSFERYMNIGPGNPERLFLELLKSVRILRKWGAGA